MSSHACEHKKLQLHDYIHVRDIVIVIINTVKFNTNNNTRGMTCLVLVLKMFKFKKNIITLLYFNSSLTRLTYLAQPHMFIMLPICRYVVCKENTCIVVRASDQCYFVTINVVRPIQPLCAFTEHTLLRE